MRARGWFGRWIPVLVWMALIFWGSTDALSAPRTSRFLGPFLRWLVPGISTEAETYVRFVIRKGGHVTEYAILALLVARARRPGNSPGLPVPRWDWAAWAVAVAYAVSDEFHQSFHASRQGSVLDVLIDSGGAALGVFSYLRWLRWRVGRVPR